MGETANRPDSGRGGSGGEHRGHCRGQRARGAAGTLHPTPGNIGLTLLPLPVSAARPAARSYAVYLDRLKTEGKVAKSKIPLGDFLIGAHAEVEGMSLVTRDPARVSVYFPAVKLIQP